MQILSAEQMRAWDRYTIEHEPISSLDLMERAAGECFVWLCARPWRHRPHVVICGRGNNGGDGLVIARRLLHIGYTVTTYVLAGDRQGSDDFETNLQRLEPMTTSIFFLKEKADLPTLSSDAIIIDALFGTGLTKPLTGIAAEAITHINKSEATVVAIDLPSGLAMEQSSHKGAVIEADFTLTFQAMKKALLLQENADFVGEVTVLDIGLSPAFLDTIQRTDTYLDKAIIKSLFKPRQRFAHKGTFGHAAIMGGSWGKMGAAVLAAHACLRTGAGLTTAVIPTCGYAVMQTALPEVMAVVDEAERELVTVPKDVDKFSAIGIGPGMGNSEKAIGFNAALIDRYRKPMVIDADGLNCLAKAPQLMQQLPSHSILTPHPKEFDRLFGEQENDFQRLATALENAKALNVIIFLKGHHTLIAMPDGQSFYNSTGNAGMAKGGSGDVLTGILTSLLAQGYAPEQAAQLGVYIHGWAGVVAAQKFSQHAMTPGDLIGCLSDVFLQLEASQ